jgi:8-oxo-dGTP diphosphatase
VLLGQRPAGRPYAGWWEFPGGKLEAGETVEQALARELHEELGLDVRASHPWVVREFVYPHAHVRLHFMRVFDFDGEPQAREGQAFAWSSPESIRVAPLLPATVPVLAWLRLAPVCAASAATALGEDAFFDRVLARLASQGRDGGRPRGCSAPADWMLLLHEPALPAARFEALFDRLMPPMRAAGVPVVVSSAHDRSFASAADGACLLPGDLARVSERPAGRLVGAWCEGAGGVEAAAQLGLDWAIVDWPCPRGLEPRVPVYARCATAAVTARELQRAGAHGLATADASWWFGTGVSC